MAGNLSGLVTGLVTAPLTARALGPEGRGEVAIVLVVATVLMTVAAAGLPWLARSALADDPLSLSFWRQRTRIVGLALLPVGLGSGVGIALTLGFSAPEFVATLVLLVLAVFAAARGVEANALISMGRPWGFGLANISASILTLLVLVVAFVAGALNVLVVLWTSVLSTAVQVALLVVFVRFAVRGREAELAARADQLRSDAHQRGGALIMRAGRAWFSQVAESVAVRGDTATVALLGSPAHVGLYSVVALIPQAAYALFTTVVQAAYSRRREGSELLRFIAVFRACGAIAVGLVVVVAPLAWWGLPIVFGQEFEASREYLPAALAVTVALATLAPMLQRMSTGGVAILPLAGVVVGSAAAVAAVAAFLPPAVIILVLASAIFIGSSIYAIVVTRGAVLSLRVDTRDWWRAEGTKDG